MDASMMSKVWIGNSGSMDAVPTYIPKKQGVE
jgi:hypothetical protein